MDSVGLCARAYASNMLCVDGLAAFVLDHRVVESAIAPTMRVTFCAVRSLSAN